MEPRPRLGPLQEGRGAGGAIRWDDLRNIHSDLPLATSITTQVRCPARTFTGLFPTGCELTVEEMLCSYRQLAESRYYDSRLYDMRGIAWGILAAFDLPDLLPCLAPRRCQFITPRDARGRTLTRSQFEKEFLALAASRGALPSGWQPTVRTLE